MIPMGKLIRQLRRQQKMTQQTLAEGIVSESVLSRIENGNSVPTIFILNELFLRLGKSLAPFEIVVSNREYEELKQGISENEWKTIIISEGDYVKDIREAKGLSQEAFSSDVYARETISNIEHGRAPQRKKIQYVLEKQGEVLVRYYGYIVTTEYEVYEQVEKYRTMTDCHPEVTKGMLVAIKEKLDCSIPLNRQFIESSELIEKSRLGELSSGELLAALENCLRYTMPEYDGSIYRMPHCQEVTILELISKCLTEVQRYDAAKQLMAEVEKKNGKKLKLA